MNIANLKTIRQLAVERGITTANLWYLVKSRGIKASLRISNAYLYDEDAVRQIDEAIESMTPRKRAAVPVM